MYNLWYNYLKKQYGKKIRLLYTDTDSLKVEAETDNYKDIHEHEEDYVLVNIQRTIPIIIKKTKEFLANLKINIKAESFVIVFLYDLRSIPIKRLVVLK